MFGKSGAPVKEREYPARLVARDDRVPSTAGSSVGDCIEPGKSETGHSRPAEPSLEDGYM
jgi:hypothetical protein